MDNTIEICVSKMLVAKRHKLDCHELKPMGLREPDSRYNNKIEYPGTRFGYFLKNCRMNIPPMVSAALDEIVCEALVV